MKLRYLVIAIVMLVCSCNPSRKFKKAHIDFIQSKVESFNVHSRSLEDSLNAFGNESTEGNGESDIDPHADFYLESAYIHGMIYFNEIDIILDACIEDDKTKQYIDSARSANFDIFLALMEFKQCIDRNGSTLCRELAQEIISFHSFFLEKTRVIDYSMQKYLEEIQ